MDAFYAKAEALRFGFDDRVPIVVIHGRSCISVSYEARKYGITRYGPTILTQVNEIKRKCPHVVLIHVDTIKPGEPYVDPYKRDLKDKLVIRTRDDEKVNLDYFRMEAEKIMSTFKKYCSCVEKASIDESFLDLTQEVNQIYDKGEYNNQDWKAKFAGGEAFLPESKQEILLMIGSQLTDKIRREIEETLKYTCSAGISYNKMLAKAASSINKPNDQTVIPERYTQEALKPLEISQLRNFGGKIAEVFNQTHYKTLGDLQKLRIEDLQGILLDNNSAKWVYFRCRGFDDEAVGEKDFSNKSLMSRKSFVNHVTNMHDLKAIFEVMLLDLATRISRVCKESEIIPRTLQVHYWDTRTNERRTKSKPINLKVQDEDTLLQLLKLKTHELLDQISNIVFPCGSIEVSVRNFEKNDLKNYTFDLLSFAQKKLKASSMEKDDDETIQENKNFEDDVPVNPEPILGREEKMKCERCEALISRSDLVGHNDFHTAQDLDRELNPNKRKYKKVNENGGIAGEKINFDLTKEITKTVVKTHNSSSKITSFKGTTVQMKSLESFFQKKSNS